jgi:hypothetical protein
MFKMKITIYSIIILSLILLAGCQNIEETLTDQTRVAQANSFTVEHPYSWSRDFISLGQEDPSVIPQGIDENKPYMVVSSHKSTTPKTKVLFSVNDLTLSELSFEEYLAYVEEYGHQNFNIISENISETEATYEYTYNFQNQQAYEIKKFIYKERILLTAVATTNYNFKDEFNPVFVEIINSINLRE